MPDSVVLLILKNEWNVAPVECQTYSFLLELKLETDSITASSLYTFLDKAANFNSQLFNSLCMTWILAVTWRQRFVHSLLSWLFKSTIRNVDYHMKLSL